MSFDKHIKNFIAKTTKPDVRTKIRLKQRVLRLEGKGFLQATPGPKLNPS